LKFQNLKILLANKHLKKKRLHNQQLKFQNLRIILLAIKHL